MPEHHEGSSSLKNGHARRGIWETMCAKGATKTGREKEKRGKPRGEKVVMQKRTERKNSSKEQRRTEDLPLIRGQQKEGRKNRGERVNRQSKRTLKGNAYQRLRHVFDCKARAEKSAGERGEAVHGAWDKKQKLPPLQVPPPVKSLGKGR